jgi:hypothetical protein
MYDKSRVVIWELHGLGAKRKGLRRVSSKEDVEIGTIPDDVPLYPSNVERGSRGRGRERALTRKPPDLRGREACGTRSTPSWSSERQIVRTLVASV